MTKSERDAARQRKIRRLRNVTVNEISLVDSPANMRKFLLFKSTGADVSRMLNDIANRDEVVAAFDNLSFERQQEFLEGLRALNKRVGELVPDDPDDLDPTGELSAQINYEFNAMAEGDQAKVLASIAKMARAMDNLDEQNISLVQKAALLDSLRLGVAMARLQLRDPGLFAEFSTATPDELRKNWSYEMDDNDQPIIVRKLRRVFAESGTHEQTIDDCGRAVWKPKARK